MKKWNVLSHEKLNRSSNYDPIIKILLKNRGLSEKIEIENFLNPKLEDVTPEKTGIDLIQLNKFIERIKKAIDNKEEIIVYGDYDVDGITGTAILWEFLYSLGAKVMPFIPDRVEEGYGLSVVGIKNLEAKIKNISLIITVDNGIVANEAVEFAKKNGIDVIITDHHTKGDKLPDALAIVHTTKLCGAGIAWLLAQQLRVQSANFKVEEDVYLELAALGTIADLVPLFGASRAIVKFGLEKLAKTERKGLRELYKYARIENVLPGVYEVGYIIAPRLNAAGRIESGMDSLRLLCTKDQYRAMKLAEKLENINRERQIVMKEATEHAVGQVRSQKSKVKSILVVAHESYREGVIGLVAGKLVEEFYRPSIVISKGVRHSKASARSIDGFNIIEFLRSRSEYFVNVGGHPMAAGFTIETEKIVEFRELTEKAAEELMDGEMFRKKLRIDCEMPLEMVTKELYEAMQALAPFGMGNPEPVFVTKNVVVEGLRVLGKDGKHLKFNFKPQSSNLKSKNSNAKIEGIGFGMGEYANHLQVGDVIDMVYTINENRWNGNVNLQLKIKDIKV